MLKFYIEEIVTIKNISLLDKATLESKVFIEEDDDKIELIGDIIFKSNGSTISGEPFDKEIRFPIDIPIGKKLVEDIDEVNLIIGDYKCYVANENDIYIECEVKIPGVKEPAIW